MFSLSNDEKAALPELGKTVGCVVCLEAHDVSTSTSESGFRLHFYKCGETSYLCGMDGKDVTGLLKERQKQNRVD